MGRKTLDQMQAELLRNRLESCLEAMGRIKFLVEHYEEPERALARIREIAEEVTGRYTDE